MLSSEDIKKLIIAFKEVFATKEDFDSFRLEMDVKFDKLITTLDALAKQMKDYHEEVVVMRSRLERMEDWIQKASQKIGLEYKA